jgi:hypothetical protein
MWTSQASLVDMPYPMHPDRQTDDGSLDQIALSAGDT